MRRSCAPCGRRNRRRRFVATAIGCLLLVALSAGVLAAPAAKPSIPTGETLRPYVYGSTMHDSNLFRFSGDDEAERRIDTTNVADTINRLGAGIRIDHPLSRQRLRLDGWVEQVRYRRFDRLDHTAADAEAAWDWKLGRRWYGTVDAGYTRGIRRFEEARSLDKDIKTTRRETADVGVRLHPRWDARAGIDRRHVGYAERDDLERLETGAFSELLYESFAGNRIGLRTEWTDGDLERAVTLPGGETVSNDFRQWTYALTGRWDNDGASTVTGRVGYTTREHDDRPERDFSGPTARLEYLWEPTVKTRIAVTGWRDLRSLEDEIASYVVAHGIRVRPRWAVTAKTTLGAHAEWRHDDYRGGRTGREDDISTVGIDLAYAMTDNLLWSLGAEHQERDSNRDIDDYRYRQLLAGVSLAF